MSKACPSTRVASLCDRESKRLRQFELLGSRRERISLDTYPDELTARDAGNSCAA